MQIRISPDDGLPIYLQIVNQVKYLIASGRLSSGEEIPPIRVLAQQLLINPNTVARAYLELERDGVVAKRHGSGTYVSDTASPLARRERLKILQQRIDALLVEASHLGVDFDELSGLLKQRRQLITPANMNNLDSPVVTQGLARRFGRKVALNQITLTVPVGCVFGLVGENGAGKTTLIKHVLGLLKPDAGSVRVFGLDPVRRPAEVLGRIGFLSEDRDLPSWMRIRELLRYLQPFYRNWDSAYANELLARFELDAEARIKNLSRGQVAKVGLLTALAHRPELLLLDEPSSGLDPVVRRDILEAIIRTVSEEGRTVVFSSHLLDEVERVCDQVAFLHEGKMVLCSGMDEIKASHHRFTLRFNAPLSAPPSLAGALHMSGSGLEWTAICDGAREQLAASATQLGARIVEECSPSLDEIFVARTTQKKGTV